MSLGVGFGDVVTLIQLGSMVYKKCRDSPGQYRQLATEALYLSNILGDIDDLTKERSIESSKKERLQECISACHEVLNDLNKELDKYTHMSSKARGLFDRLEWDQQEARDLRSRLTSTVTMLSAFYTTLNNSQLLQIQKTLDHYFSDLRNGHADPDSVSILTTEGDFNDESAWRRIALELRNLGLPPDIVNNHRNFVTQCIADAFNQGKLPNAPIPLRADSNFSTNSGKDTATPNLMEFSVPPQSTGHGSLSLQTTALKDETRVYEYYIPGGGSDSPIVLGQAIPSSYEVPEQNPLSPNEGRAVGAWHEKPSSYEVMLSQDEREEHQLRRKCKQDLAYLWNVKDWDNAIKCLEWFKPPLFMSEDTRAANHLRGIILSYSGKFIEAKKTLELSLGSIARIDVYNAHSRLTVATARWLGDVCLQLGELPNALMAWSLAVRGLDFLLKLNGKEPSEEWLFEDDAFTLFYDTIQLMSKIGVTSKLDAIDIFPQDAELKRVILESSALFVNRTNNQFSISQRKRPLYILPKLLDAKPDSFWDNIRALGYVFIFHDLFLNFDEAMALASRKEREPNNPRLTPARELLATSRTQYEILNYLPDTIDVKIPKPNHNRVGGLQLRLVRRFRDETKIDFNCNVYHSELQRCTRTQVTIAVVKARLFGLNSVKMLYNCENLPRALWSGQAGYNTASNIVTQTLKSYINGEALPESLMAVATASRDGEAPGPNTYVGSRKGYNKALATAGTSVASQLINIAQ